MLARMRNRLYLKARSSESPSAALLPRLPRQDALQWGYAYPTFSSSTYFNDKDDDGFTRVGRALRRTGVVLFFSALASGLYQFVATSAGASQLSLQVFITLISLATLSSAFIFTRQELHRAAAYVDLPLQTENEVKTASLSIKRIKAKLGHAALADYDTQALVTKACKLYDDFLLGLEKVHGSDPKTFERIYKLVSRNPQLLKREGLSNDPYALWLQDVLAAVGTLHQVDRDLDGLIRTHVHAQDLERRARAALEAAEQNFASEVNLTRNQITDSLGEIKLREEIKKKSSLELEEFVKTLESR